VCESRRETKALVCGVRILFNTVKNAVYRWWTVPRWRSAADLACGAFLLWHCFDDGRFGHGAAAPMAPTAEEVRQQDEQRLAKAREEERNRGSLFGAANCIIKRPQVRSPLLPFQGVLRQATHSSGPR